MLRPWLRMTCILGVMESMAHCLHNWLNSCSKKQTMVLHALSYNLIMITSSNNRLEVLEYFQITINVCTMCRILVHIAFTSVFALQKCSIYSRRKQDSRIKSSIVKNCLTCSKVFSCLLGYWKRFQG